MSRTNDLLSEKTTRILTRRDVEQLLDLDECILAVERALRSHAEGRSIPPGVLGVHVAGGGFHIKTAGLTGAPGYFAAKLNGNFDANQQRFGLPRIQGLIVLCDSASGYPLAVLDSTYITAVRTAAATAVAARYLARTDADTAGICGCGVQGRLQLAALCRVLPIRRAFAWDLDGAVAEAFAADLGAELGIQVTPVASVAEAARSNPVTITCTPSRAPLLGPDDLPPGAFVAAVGADSEDKQELEPALLQRSAVVVDHLEQCATIGELHHALEQGMVTRADVRAELSDVVAGRAAGRQSEDEIVVFDSTGIALQDVAAAVVVFEKARQLGVGAPIQIL